MTIGVGIGLAECPFADGSGFWRWVDMCEAGGVDSIWQTDRIISPMPMLECMSVMAALAGRTKRMRFGMNVVSLAMRDPVLCAKQCATIDFSLRRACAAGVRDRLAAGAGMGGDGAQYQDARTGHGRGA